MKRIVKARDVEPKSTAYHFTSHRLPEFARPNPLPARAAVSLRILRRNQAIHFSDARDLWVGVEQKRQKRCARVGARLYAYEN